VDSTVLIEPAGDASLSVWAPDLPGCVSTGLARDEALASIVEAIRGHIEVLRDSGQPVPPPRSSATTVRAA
jgi:predicted RNase H-like HicB family nuclease